MGTNVKKYFLTWLHVHVHGVQNIIILGFLRIGCVPTTNRRQMVILKDLKLNTHTSSWKVVTHVLPQDSVLGSLLFLLYYITDLPKNLSCSSTILLVDDTTFVINRENHVKLEDKLNITLLEAKDWFATNWLPINKTKTQLIHFSTHKTSNYPI